MGGPWRRMIVANDHAYVMWSMMGGIDIIDVSEPTRPVKVGYYEGIRSQFSIEAVGNYVGIGGWSRVTILDVSDPVHPVQIGKPAHIPGDVTGIIVNGRYAYTGNYGVESSKGLIGTGLHVVDIADPRAVVEVGTYEPDYIGEGRKFGIGAVDETEVYLRGETHLWVLDVSNPSMPDFAKLYRKPEGTRDVAVAAGHIYVATEKEGLLVFRPRD
jgi:hypothetical protein